ncbi:hypothetical protein BSZ35_17825 [Salinibacter sp. 10B]|uniref:hypothetical protein n=1 Tax=Salinibacter sp. 10B TaxID=1923971 RepID=UPI000CF4D415|nr:hypothetical protein [Salinibacter sp. 10B]PQJ26794.1 hypothetical protein BSZ35_17825 [Salinibacter sp. 10B]
MIRTALKVIGGILLLAVLGLGLWWHISGLHFLYSQFSPSTEQIIGDQEVPRSLPDAEWRADLDSLEQILQQRLIYFEDAYGLRRLARQVDSLKRLVPTQTRAERVLSVARLLDLSTPGTRHTTLPFIQRPISWRLLPMRIFEFDDGYYIVHAEEETLIGNEVLAIGETPADSVAATLAPWGITSFAEPLRAVGVVEQTDEIPVRMQTPSGRQVTRGFEPKGAWSLSTVLYEKGLQEPVKGEWSPANAHPRERNYWLSYRDSTDLLYVQFNRVRNASSEWTIADLADSMRVIADTRPLDKVALDLRNNGGGNHDLVEPIVDLLGSHPKIDRPGALYTLLSRMTFSAAGTLALELERRTKTIFVGEPGAFAPNMWGDTVPFVLPNSKLVGNVSYRYWQASLPDDPRTQLVPEIPVPFTSDQHFSDTDSAMIALRRHEPAPHELVSLTESERASFTGTYRLSPIHRAQVTNTGDGLQVVVDRGRLASGLHPFMESDLYPLSSTHLATDIADVRVRRRSGSNELTLAWKDTTYVLTPVDSTFTLPTEDLRAGRYEQAANRLRRARSSGFKLDSWITTALTARADTLEARDDPEDALRYNRLAVELFPESWRVYSSLAHNYELLGQTAAAISAYRRFRALDPSRAEAVNERLRKLERSDEGREE